MLRQIWDLTIPKLNISVISLPKRKVVNFYLTIYQIKISHHNESIFLKTGGAIEE